MAKIEQINDNAGNILGSVSDRSRTDDATPSLVGSAKPGDTVRIYLNGSQIAEVDVSSSGTWSYDLPELSAGKNRFAVSSVDANGVESAIESKKSIIVDQSVDDAINISLTANNTLDIIEISQAGTTKDSTPTIAGNAERKSTVEIFDDGKSIATVKVDAGGRWELPLDLVDGEHSITVQVTDLAGNISNVSDAITFTVEPNALAPTIAPTVDNLSTEDTGATITGTAVLNQGDELTVTIDNQDYTTSNGLVLNGVDSTWSLDLPNQQLLAGEYDVSATISNALGDISDTTSNELEITTALHSPASAPPVTVSAAVVLPPGSVIVDGGFTNDNTPLIRGRATPGSEVRMSTPTEDYGPVITPADGIWSIQISQALPEGQTQFSASATNSAGTAYFGYTLTIDTIAPDAPLIIKGFDNVGGIQGDLNSGDHTDDDTPKIYGEGVAGSTIKVFSNGDFLGTALVDSSGEWSYTPTSSLNQGLWHTITATVQDDAGNESPASNSLELFVDRIAELATITSIANNEGSTTSLLPLDGTASTDDETPLITGAGQAGATVEIFSGSVSLGTTVVDQSGTWSFEPSAPLDERVHSISVSHTDKAGNVSGRSNPIDVEISLTNPVQAVDDSGYYVYRQKWGYSFISVDPLANDINPDGLDLKITSLRYNGNEIGYTFGSGRHWNDGGMGTNIIKLYLGAINRAIEFEYTVEDSLGNTSDAKITLSYHTVSSPLVLDLNSNGIETLSVDAGVLFDIDADGDKDATGWVGKSDGLLALDLNGDGVINDASELFGEHSVGANGEKSNDGFAALSEIDSNNDGVINAEDTLFTELKVWRDANSNGLTDAGELLSLAEAGVKEISVSNKDIFSENNGNISGLAGEYTDTSGMTQAIEDVWFLYNENTDSPEKIAESQAVEASDSSSIESSTTTEALIIQPPSASDDGTAVVFPVSQESIDLNPDMVETPYETTEPYFENPELGGEPIDESALLATPDAGLESLLNIALSESDLKSSVGDDENLLTATSQHNAYTELSLELSNYWEDHQIYDQDHGSVMMF